MNIYHFIERSLKYLRTRASMCICNVVNTKSKKMKQRRTECKMNAARSYENRKAGRKSFSVSQRAATPVPCVPRFIRIPLYT